MEFCPECGTRLHGIPIGPCPTCSGTRRDVAVFAPTVEAKAEVPAPTISVAGGTMHISVTRRIVIDPRQDLQGAPHYELPEVIYSATKDDPYFLGIIDDATGALPFTMFMNPSLVHLIDEMRDWKHHNLLSRFPTSTA